MTRRPSLLIDRQGWVGFGRADPQLDLFRSAWRIGFWTVSFERDGKSVVATILAFRRGATKAIGSIEDKLRRGDGQ